MTMTPGRYVLFEWSDGSFPVGQVIHEWRGFLMLRVGGICTVARSEDIYAAGSHAEMVALRNKLDPMVAAKSKAVCAAWAHVDEVRDEHILRIKRFLSRQQS